MKKLIALCLITLFLIAGCKTKNISSQEIDKEYIKKFIKIEMTKDDVKEILGEDFAVVLSSMDDTEVWRYDFKKSWDYEFHQEYDFADIEGILNNLLYGHFFISWDEEEKVESFTYLYLNEKEGKIYQFSNFQNGYIKDIPIT
ncbi:hypothetical protein [Serpentinicella alkaliphila]|uniref:Beta-lactamase-inhibitor-like PepSY-like domain-containing protein n=1 Tax=Serpentinicella alkaliphila TaxID=1734049 RepID=A0A4R2UAF0_9FIRM|nr:hypothetical protein [Serpentinicella alkaliphila]QUH24567.1 hypothetical protein HZR23_01315 [Serpentinicella alkaliphila]TCQ04663.1 hypothetical protein EDD79_100667 [Serpentinicella alkaliphila]